MLVLKISLHVLFLSSTQSELKVTETPPEVQTSLVSLSGETVMDCWLVQVSLALLGLRPRFHRALCTCESPTGSFIAMGTSTISDVFEKRLDVDTTADGSYGRAGP